MVSASRPRAKRAAGLLPLWRWALISMARRMGTPFQCVMWHARAEALGLEPGGQLRHHEAGCPLVHALLDEEGEEGLVRLEGLGQDVVGVEVAQRREDVGDLGVELDVRTELFVGQLRQAVLEQAELLERVHGVHGPLER